MMFRFTPDALKSIRHDRREGRSAREIAERLGCNIGQLYRICKLHGIDLGDSVTGTPCEVRLGPIALRRIEDEAARRGVSVRSLASRTLETVAADGLFGAVLDR